MEHVRGNSSVRTLVGDVTIVAVAYAALAIFAELTAAGENSTATPSTTPPAAFEMATPDVATLLQMQRSGQYSSPIQQTLPGDAQTRAWKRYLDSFSHPVPERYINDAFREK